MVVTLCRDDDNFVLTIIDRIGSLFECVLFDLDNNI